MSYQEEAQARLRRRSSKQAIALAMQGRWREAVAANESLIESFPNDVDAYNRLGRACMELGEYARAREAYSRALELAPYNAIARKNLQRLSHLVEAIASPEGDFRKVEPQLFIEEMGKAGVVNLHRLAPREVLAKMGGGDRVYLKVDGPNLVAENARGEYLGQVEDRNGRRLAKLMKGGNEYTAVIISSVEDMVTVIIREVYQHPSQVGQFSFPSKRFLGLRPYAGDRIIRRELEYEGGLPTESGYTIIGGGEPEAFVEDFSDDVDDDTNDEE